MQEIVGGGDMQLVLGLAAIPVEGAVTVVLKEAWLCFIGLRHLDLFVFTRTHKQLLLKHDNTIERAMSQLTAEKTTKSQERDVEDEGEIKE